MPTEIDMREIGSRGLEIAGGFTNTEWNRTIRSITPAKLYTEMRDNDAVIGAIFQILEFLLTSQEWKVKQGEGRRAREAVRFLEDCMGDMEHPWADFIHEALSFLQYGWAFHEIVYKIRDDGKIGWRKLPLRAQTSLDSWVTDNKNEVVAMVQQDPYIQFGSSRSVIPSSKAVHFTTTPFKGNPEGRSVLRSAVRSYLFLKRLQEIEAIGIEREMAGLPVLHVPTAYLDKDAPASIKNIVADFKRMLMQLRNDERAAVVIPAEEEASQNGTGPTVKTGFKLEFKAGGGKRAIDTNVVISRYENRIATTLMGQFILLGSGGGSGSYALADKQAGTFTMALQAALTRLAEAINKQLIPPLMEMNGYDVREYPTLEAEELNDISLATMATYVNQLVAAKVIEPDEELEAALREFADLPEKGEPRVDPASLVDPNAPPNAQGGASNAAPANGGKQPGNDGKSGKDKVNVRTEPPAGKRRAPK